MGTFLQLSCEFRGVSVCLLFSSLVSVSCALHLALLYNSSHITTQPLKTMLESNREVFKVAFSCYNSDIIMSAMASQIAGVSIVCSTICSGAHQKNIEALRHWPLWGESTGVRWIPLTKGQWRGKCFYLMTSSCYWWVLLVVVAFNNFSSCEHSLWEKAQGITHQIYTHIKVVFCFVLFALYYVLRSYHSFFRVASLV